FGLVGESGSGKSTIGRAIVNLYQPTDGDIIFDGKSWTERQTTQSKLAFNKEVQMIFQDPYASLNPRMKVNDIIAEGLDVHNLVGNKKERAERVYELLEAVGRSEEHTSELQSRFDLVCRRLL